MLKRITMGLLIPGLMIGLFTGCELSEGDGITGGVQVYCDKEKNVEYLFSKDGYAGGLSRRYNSDGSISKCH